MVIMCKGTVTKTNQLSVKEWWEVKEIWINYEKQRKEV